ncbi:hypothetical protein, partial [Vibrio parahaemolyticus]|uniref:hypothetical protein n=1 Tax=Vibrio parahaemolyticus TaxID=670 RepID=UPI001C5F06FE
IQALAYFGAVICYRLTVHDFHSEQSLLSSPKSFEKVLGVLVKPYMLNVINPPLSLKGRSNVSPISAS